MLGWAVTFLIIALVAAVFGFTGIAAGIAKGLPCHIARRPA